jgi:hypothetical protein
MALAPGFHDIIKNWVVGHPMAKSCCKISGKEELVAEFEVICLATDPLLCTRSVYQPD